MAYYIGWFSCAGLPKRTTSGRTNQIATRDNMTTYILKVKTDI